MAIFDRIPKSELGTTYTHYGLIHGWVPVLYGELDSDCPVVAVEDWVPDWIEPIARWAYEACDFLADLLVPGYKSDGFLMLIRGEVNRGGGRKAYPTARKS